MQFLILKLINNLVSNADSVNLELPKNWHFNQKPGDFYADDKVSHRFIFSYIYFFSIWFCDSSQYGYIFLPDHIENAAAAATKSLQSCTTLCNPVDSSPPGSPIPGILQARTLEWVAVCFYNA